jgi:putative aldouronate transport system substrate-binding protein
MKRAAAAALCLGLAARAAALGGAEAEAPNGRTPVLSAPGRLPLVAEPVTLTAFAPSIGFIADFKTNAFYRWIEESTNVRIEWIEAGAVDAKNKLSMLLASGDYPDIIFGASGAGLSVQDVYRYGKRGVFLPLNGLIERQGYWVKEMFAAEPSFKSIITSPDGKIYGLPAVFTDDYHMTMRQKFWINRAWLDKLGLAMPTTAEEFYRVMKAFKEGDPNGNGLADEIPMTGAKRHLEDLALWIMNAFVPAGGQDDSGDAMLNCYEFIVDGQVSFSADKKEFREGLKFIRRLYVEGLLDLDALTQDRAQIKPLIEGGVNRVGGVASHHPGNFCALTDDPTKPFHDYAALPPLRGPAGARNTPWFIDAVIKPGEFVITSRCRYPEIAFRWADHFYSLESMLRDKGVEGVHWARVLPGEDLVAFNGLPAKYKYLQPLKMADNAQINMGPGWTRDLKNEFAKSAGFSYEEFLYDATKLYEPYQVRRYPYGTVAVADEVFAEFNDLRRTIHSYVAEATDRFIIGDMDLDAQWGEYLRQLDRIGLPRFLAILRESL